MLLKITLPLIHAHGYECTNGKRIDTIEYGPLQTCAQKLHRQLSGARTVYTIIIIRHVHLFLVYIQDFTVYVCCMPSRCLQRLDKPFVLHHHLFVASHIMHDQAESRFRTELGSANITVQSRIFRTEDDPTETVDDLFVS